MFIPFASLFKHVSIFVMKPSYTTFIYFSDFSKYIKVEGTSEDALIISLKLELKILYLKNKRDIYMIYLRNGIQSIINLMKIFLII